MSFECGNEQLSAQIVQCLHLFKKVVGYGGCGSSASITHGDPTGLIRLSVGIEDAKDLISDLSQALDQAVVDHHA